MNTVVDGDLTAPTVTATGGTLTCSVTGSIVTLQATTNGTIVQWTGPNGFTSGLASPLVSEAGTYTVTVVGDNGCDAQATAIVVNDMALPMFTAQGGTITCGAASVTLTVSNLSPGASVVEWTAPNGFISASANPTVSVAQVYTVTAVSYTHLTLPTKRIV